MKILPIAVVSTIAALAAIATAQTAPDPVVFDFSTSDIRSSKWRLAAGIQAGLNRELPGQSPIKLDGSLGRGARAALANARMKPGFPSGSPGVLTETVAMRLAPGAGPLPFEKAFAAWLSFEGTDYDCVEIHIPGDKVTIDEYREAIGPELSRVCVDRSEARSGLTWGPYGATAGRGREVQLVLREAITKGVDVAKVFADAGAASFDGFLAINGPISAATDRKIEEFLGPVLASREQRIAWRKAFARLGQMPEVRGAYERVAFQGNWLKPGLEVARQLYSEFGAEMSEIDFAFAGDRIMHRGAFAASRLNTSLEVLRPIFTRLRTEHAIAPANLLVRLAVIEAYQPTGAKELKDRRGRDMAFVVEGLAANSITVPADWTANYDARASGRMAGMFGLADSRPAPAEIDLAPASVCRWSADPRPY